MVWAYFFQSWCDPAGSTEPLVDPTGLKHFWLTLIFFLI